MKAIQQYGGLGLMVLSFPFFMFAVAVWIGGLVPAANPFRLFSGTTFWQTLQEMGTFRQVLVALVPGLVLWGLGLSLIRRAG